MRAASAVLVGAGLLLVLGAQAPWVTCSQEPCDGFGLQHIWVRSGFDVGWGAATAFLGVAIVGAAVLGARRLVGLLVAGAAGVVALAIAIAFALRVWIVPEYDSYGPQVGFVATAIGGLIAALGAPWLRTRERRESMSRRAGRSSSEARGGDPRSG